jgi:hypothetical protein
MKKEKKTNIPNIKPRAMKTVLIIVLQRESCIEEYLLKDKIRHL